MKRILIGMGVLFCVASALAQEGFVQEEPHEHGAALLNVVLEGESLSMEFVSPAVNLVGFEYEPSTDEEVRAVEDALTQLRDGAALFAPAEAARCELMSAEAEREVTDEEGHAEGTEETGGAEETGDAEETGAEGEDHEDHEDHEEGAVHSEFHATYEFTCAQPDRLSGISLRELFALYPGIEDLGVQYVLPGGQGAAELGPTTDMQLTF